jgi:GGDEF domain-containing protein
LEQLAEDSALVVIANAFGAALRPRDLLIRKAARELVCLLRGLSPTQVEQRLAVVRQELDAVPNLAANLTVGYAVLHDDETIKDASARAADPRSQE